MWEITSGNCGTPASTLDSVSVSLSTITVSVNSSSTIDLVTKGTLGQHDVTVDGSAAGERDAAGD